MYTARYANKTLATHPAAKVQTSLGAPKFRLPYDLAATIRELAPAGWMPNKPQPEFSDQYTRLLERRGGIPYFARRLAEVAAAVDVDELVLLCFEDVRAPGAWCHRRLFAEWWEERMGEVVPELAEGAEQLEF